MDKVAEPSKPKASKPRTPSKDSDNKLKGKSKPNAKRPKANKSNGKGPDNSGPKTKRKKTKAQKNKAKELEAVADVNLRDRKSQVAAIEYLHQWGEDRANWKFQKVRQTYLLQEWHNPYLVVKADFKLLLQYLQGLQGVARATTRTHATSIAAMTTLPPNIALAAEQAAKDNEEEFDLATVTPILLKVLHKRAAKLLKMLPAN
eukprot:m.17098 g.17098  ORF g.17098 m.17098 type:complete len:203 (+) comp10648_c0_seq1:120-728(+)